MTSTTDRAVRAEFEQERRRLIPSELDKIGWPEQRMQSLRDERLRHLVRHARTNSSWHRSRLAHVDLTSLTGDDLSHLPTMTKADVMGNWDQIVCDPELTLAGANHHLALVERDGPGFMLGSYLVFLTGGSSGRRGVFPWHWRDLLQSGLSAGRTMAALSQPTAVASPVRVASIGSVNPMSGTGTSAWLHEAFDGVEAENRSAHTPIQELVHWLNEFRPAQLSAYSSVLYRLALEAQRGELDIDPQAVSAFAEPVHHRLRHLVQHVWSVGLVNLYAALECLSIAVSAPGEADLHLVEDVAIVETVDADQRAVRPGERGHHLLVTSLCNHTMPLIRYELDDQVAETNGPTPGVRHGRCLQPPEARSDQYFWYGNGAAVDPAEVRRAVETDPQIVEFQARQTSGGMDLDIATCGAADLGQLRERLESVLRDAGISSPAVQVTEVPAVPRIEGSAKLRRFVPMETAH